MAKAPLSSFAYLLRTAPEVVAMLRRLDASTYGVATVLPTTLLGNTQAWRLAGGKSNISFMKTMGQ